MPTGLAAMGGVDSDGTIAPIDDLLSRLGGLSSTNCDSVIVPASNSDALLDLLVVGDIRPFLRYQLFSAVTLKDAIVLADDPLPAAIQKARLDFDEVRDVAMKSGTPENVVVRTEAVRERLRAILKLAPGHASAQSPPRAPLGDVPANPPPVGTRLEPARHIAAYRPFMEVGGDLLVTGASETLRGKTTTALTAVRDKLDPGAIPLADALGDFATAFEEYGKVKFKGSQQGRTLKDKLTGQWDAMLKMVSSPGKPESPAPPASPGSDALEKEKDAGGIDFGLGGDDNGPR
jgi:hypothetical protein